MHLLLAIVNCTGYYRWIESNPNLLCSSISNQNKIIDSYPTLINEQSYVYFAVFSYKIINFLEKRGPLNLKNTCFILYYIVNYLPKLTDQLKFISISAYNSGNFNVLKLNEEKYGPKGILHIKGESEYQKIAELTNDKSWIDELELMERINTKSIIASILWWSNNVTSNESLYNELAKLF